MIIVTAMLLHAFKPQALTRGAEARVAALESNLALANAAQEALARDWLKKFHELDAKWTKLEDHVGAKVAGTVAQLTNKGFGR